VIDECRLTLDVLGEITGGFSLDVIDFAT